MRYNQTKEAIINEITTSILPYLKHPDLKLLKEELYDFLESKPNNSNLKLKFIKRSSFEQKDLQEKR